MAKSFKQLAAAKDEQPKRTSEKDIFDFLEEDRKPASVQKPTPKSHKASKNISNTNNTSNKSVEVITPVTSVTNSTSEEMDVRQTFVIGESYLERLKDYVHTQRIQGRYDYTQKQALHDALDALFKDAAIEPRPEHIRRQEETRKRKIRKGIPK